MHCSLPLDFHCLSQRQIVFLGPLERRNLFWPKNKVSSHEKLVFRSVVRFLFLFVLTKKKQGIGVANRWPGPISAIGKGFLGSVGRQCGISL